MHRSTLVSLMLSASALGAASAQAQTPPAPPEAGGTADGIAFDVPYGMPIGAEMAQRAIAAVAAEATKHRWKMNISVVDTHGELVHF